MLKKTGFTIVELLIVIVVIAILAAITVVAYNGISERARYSAMKHDINALEKIVKLYYADNGFYPNTSSTNQTVITSVPITIPNTIPKYASSPVTIPNDGIGGYYAYISSAGGQDYKIVRLIPIDKTLPSIEQADSNPDPRRPNRGWGVWSSGGRNL